MMFNFTVNDSYDFYNETDYENPIFQLTVATAGTVMAAIACLLNSLALLIFVRYKSTSMKSGIRLLTFTEILLTGSRVVSDLFLLTNNNHQAFSYAFTLTSILLCIRNWWIGVITVLRCVAIFRPFNAARLLTQQRQTLAFVLICLPSISINISRHILLFWMKSKKMDIPVFVYQVGIPVPIVLITSLTMAVYLVHSPRVPHISQGHNTVHRATRTVLALAITFFLLQSPVLIHSIFIYLGRSSNQTLNAVCNLSSVLDSSANFVIFLVNSRNFKLGLCAFFGCAYAPRTLVGGVSSGVSGRCPIHQANLNATSMHKYSMASYRAHAEVNCADKFVPLMPVQHCINDVKI